MSDWTSEELSRIAAADELELASLMTTALRQTFPISGHVCVTEGAGEL